MNGVELVSGWFTPTVLFCVLNLMIGTIFITSTLKPQKKHRETGDSEEAPHPPPIVRVPSFLERVKSINLSRYRAEPTDPVQSESPAEEQPQAVTEQVHEHVTKEPHHVTRSKSESVPAKEAPARILKKSASEKAAAVAEDGRDEWQAAEQRRPATMREAVGGDEEVDEKADDFINRFKQQLKLQRLDSILRYREMHNRGAGR